MCRVLVLFEFLWVRSRSASRRLRLHWCLMLHDVCVNKASTRWQELKSPINKVPRLCCYERGIYILSWCYLCVYIGLFTYLLKWIHVFFSSKLIIIQSLGRRVWTVSKRWIKCLMKLERELLWLQAAVGTQRGSTHAVVEKLDPCCASALNSWEAAVGISLSFSYTHFSGYLQKETPQWVMSLTYLQVVCTRR